MVKTDPMPLTKEEKDKILQEAQLHNDFDYLLYKVLSTTGRRIGELYGLEATKEIGRKVVGKRIIYIKGQPYRADKTIPIYKKLGKWRLGVRVQDIDFEKGTMRTWVLKRGRTMPDETVLHPDILNLIRIFVKKNRLRQKDHVFRRPGRSYRNINNVLKRYAKLSDVPLTKKFGDIKTTLSIHSFRHYFITELKRRGWSNDKIMVFTGHKTANVLKVYSHVVPMDMREDYINVVNDL